MGKMGRFLFADMKKLQKQLNKIQQGNAEVFVDACAKELAVRLLEKVIGRTPVGQYPASSDKDGTLRRGWTSKTHEEAASGGKVSAKAYVDSLKIHYFGNILVIEIANPVEYASDVEYGYRTADHKGWVKGQFMLTTSEQEIQNIAPKVLEAKIKKFLMECMQ